MADISHFPHNQSDTHAMSAKRRPTAPISIIAKRLVFAGALAALSGCASMSPEECRTADWHEKGVRDGLHGEPRAYIEEHREACGKVGIVPNAALWERGRSEGIRQYCTPENGLNEGRRGASYQNSCPPELEGAFLDRYRAGRRAHEAEQRVERLSNEQRNKEYELDRAKDEKDRERLRRQIRDLDFRLRNARNDLYYEERRLYR